MSQLRKKAQSIMSDFSLSVAVFLTAVLIIYSAYNEYKNDKNTEYLVYENTEILKTISTQLIKTKGYPENWNTTTLKTLGWVSDYPELNRTKLNYTLNLSYETLLKSLGISQKNIFINLSQMNGTPYYIYRTNSSIGKPIDPDADYISGITRIGYIRDETRKPVIINIYLWS